MKIKNLYKTFGKPLFEDFNLEIKDNEITCILGASGVGKTSLLKMIASLIPYQGEITAYDKVAFIFQDDRLVPNLTVLDNILLVNPKVSIQRIEEMLDLLQLSGYAKRYPKSLSGGEAKRVAIARAFLYESPIILLDEPFSSLDLALKVRLINYFKKLWSKEPKTVILVTHDLDEALLLGQHIMILSDGKIGASWDVGGGCSEKTDLRAAIIKELLDK